jgi:hypothetical protein
LAEPLKTLSFQVAESERVDVVLVRLADGRLVPRLPSELVKRPTPPAAPSATKGAR